MLVARVSRWPPSVDNAASVEMYAASLALLPVASAFVAAFKRHFGMTPGRYRPAM